MKPRRLRMRIVAYRPYIYSTATTEIFRRTFFIELILVCLLTSGSKGMRSSVIVQYD